MKGMTVFSVRVISGSAKRTSLKMPRGGKVRPTADRVKEALFNILGPTVQDTFILDLFAGSGALGIEALSRGGAYCFFVEKDRLVMDTLKKNVEKTKLLHKAEFINKDVGKGLKLLAGKKVTFDFVFMDPPYRQQLEIVTLEQLSSFKLLVNGAVVVMESDKNQLFPDKVSSLSKVRCEKYGNTMLTFYIHRTVQEEEENTVASRSLSGKF
jgi:16S rRNA (guanine(966)-N(2))-methyltransferase RsmD